MADDAEHSLLSASGASGWMRCAGKPAMEANRPDSSSEFADEGTAAHTVAAWVLERRVLGESVTAQAYLGVEVTVGERKFTVDREMADNVDAYVDAFMIWSNGPGRERFVEVRVNYAGYLGVDRAKAWGTSDGVALIPGAEAEDFNGKLLPAGDELQVHDLKYGKGVRVFAKDNEQLRLYALGTLAEYELAWDVRRVRMVIHQPRLDHVDEDVLTVGELRSWAADHAAPAAKAAIAALEAEDVGPHLSPGEKQCRWCKAKAVCPALATEVARTVQANAASSEAFEDLTVKAAEVVPNYNGDALGLYMDKIPLIEAWMTAVRAEVARRLHAGEDVPSPAGGYELVEGKLGNRSWTDEKAVASKLRALGVSDDDLFNKKLISPADADKRFKATPARLEAIRSLITRKPGAPSVAPKAEGRKPLAQQTLDAFEDHTQGAHPFRD